MVVRSGDNVIGFVQYVGRNFGEQSGEVFKVNLCAERRRKHALPRVVSRARLKPQD